MILLENTNFYSKSPVMNGHAINWFEIPVTDSKRG
jgi:hypothetical protein